MSILLLFIAFFVLLFLGVPIAVSLGMSSLIFVLFEGVPDILVLHNMINGVNSFPLIAIPFFILAGNLMNTSGISDRIFGFARAVIGWVPGGLGFVNVGASIIFAGMSGAAVADAGGLGNVEIKAMEKSGYDKEFAVGITAASSTIGPIIPPSMPLIIYGIVANTSIGELFVAGIIPGFLMAFALCIMVFFYSKFRNYPCDSKFQLLNVIKTLKSAFAALLTPLIIVGGITSGIFTPTEAAIAAVFYSLFLGLVVYRSISFQQLTEIFSETLETTASILLIVAGAFMFSWILSANQVAEILSHYLFSITDNKIIIILLMTLLVLFVGLFMETVAAIAILVPVLLPIVIQIGMDPVHFGILIILNLMLGLLTPPVGMVLFVLSKVSNLSFERCFVATAPFLIPLVSVLLLLSFVPQISLFLPQIIYR